MNARWRTALGYLLLPLALFANLAMYALAVGRGWPLELSVAGMAMATFAIGWRLEAVLPFRAAWRRDHGDARTDRWSAGFIVLVADPVLKAAFALVVPAMASLVPVIATGGLRTLPLWLQVVLATLLIELGKYWSHRLHHALPWLWCLHAHHHASERLYALNGLRFHPLNHAINLAASVLPAMLAGFDARAILGYLAFSYPIVLLQHANLDLRGGWLDRLLSTNVAHRWHHSTQPGEANRNYGNALLVWDHLFGTFHPSASGRSPARIGLFASSRSPGSGYLAQLWWCRRPRDPAGA